MFAASYPASLMPGSAPGPRPRARRPPPPHAHDLEIAPQSGAPRRLVLRLNIEHQSIWGANHSSDGSPQVDERITPITTIKRHRAAAEARVRLSRSLDGSGGPLIIKDLEPTYNQRSHPHSTPGRAGYVRYGRSGWSNSDSPDRERVCMCVKWFVRHCK